MRKILFIIGGWHFFKKGFYQIIKNISKNNSNINFFVSSHRKKEDINKKTLGIIRSIKNCQLIHFENVGFDWGMYSQAVDNLETSILEYDYIFFMHDDIKIKNLNFIEKFILFIEENNLAVVGNSFNSDKMSFHETHPQIIKWGETSEWQIHIKSKSWTTVRGSFWVAKKSVFEKIRRIPFKVGENIRSGNWGLILFAGQVTDLFGPSSIDIISNELLRSPYINEYYRGKKVIWHKISIKYKKVKRKYKKKILRFISKLYNKLKIHKTGHNSS